jgi:PEP-CTERM motif
MKKLIVATITTALAASAFAQGTVVFNNAVFGVIETRVYAGNAANPWPTRRIVGNSPGDFPAGSANYAGLSLIGTAGSTLGGPTTFASLLGAPGFNAPESRLIPASGGGVTYFRTGIAAGVVYPTTATFNNIPPDAPAATLQMVAWDNSSGLYPSWTQASVAYQSGLILAGYSDPWNQDNIGGFPTPPPNMINGSDPSQHVQSFNLFLIPEPATFALAGSGAATLLMFRRRKDLTALTDSNGPLRVS